MDDILNRSIRCPKLGSFVTLSYCLREGGNLPCRFILGCFQDLGNRLLSILRDMYSPEELRKAFSPPEDPYARLIKRIDLVRSQKKK